MNEGFNDLLHVIRKSNPKWEQLLDSQHEEPIPKRFYCHWDLPGDEKQYNRGVEMIDDIHGRCCFNHRIGLPTRKWEGDETKAEQVIVPLTRFNLRLLEAYHKHRKYSVNKCRGSGMSEILTIRYMIFKYAVLNETENRKCIILPGTSSKLSDEFSTRIKAICDKIPQVYGRVPTSPKPKEFAFRNGGRIVLTSATPDADRGFENVGDIIMEEVAHWDMVDDMPVYNASEAVHNKTMCHVIHATTPRGKRGFYYNLVWSEEATSDYYKDLYNWREVTGIPVPTIEMLQEYVREHGEITQKDIKEWRKQFKQAYKSNSNGYRDWFDEFFEGKSFDEIVDVPIGLLEINSIVKDSLTSRATYDQELDNQFIATDNRAFGDFYNEEYDPLDLQAQLSTFDNDLAEYNRRNPT